MRGRLGRSKTWIGAHKKPLLICLLIVIDLAVCFVVFSYIVIGRYEKYIYQDTIALAAGSADSKPVGIVLGGGVIDGKPRPLLEDRLRTAAKALEDGLLSKVIVSGDNRRIDYNEPEVMKNYLIQEMGIDQTLIQLDNAGRSTYESCERAAKIFQLRTAVLISETTHLPRAIYLCRSFGVEAYGLASNGRASENLRASQGFREIMARTKAILNVYIVGEKTVLGDPIPVP